MKKEDLKHFIDNLDVEEFKQYFYYHDRKETREHFGLSAGNLNDVLHHFNIKMPKELRNERRVQTYNDKYGCDNVFQSDYFKEKNAQTRLDRYGDPNYSNHEQAIKTIHDTIGMDELNRRRSAGHQRRSTEDVAKSNQKRKETCINKYGVDHIPQTDDSIRKMGASQSNRLNALSDEEKSIIYRKAHETKKKNGSYRKSVAEDRYYDYLCTIYPKVIRQYRDESRYPYNCDFYIPDEDLFIEYNGHPTHNTHPYDESSESDVEILNRWKEESATSKFYFRMIDVWSIRDPSKIKSIIKNKLNALIIYPRQVKNTPDLIIEYKNGVLQK